MPLPFRASHLKCERAVRHFEELKALADSYTGRGPVTLVFERIEPEERFSKYHPAGTQFVGLVARVREDVPETLAAIAGDVVHNLRSALDILICDLVRNADPSFDLHDVCFPFSRNADDLECALIRANVARAGESAVDLIRAWEPYVGGSAGLYELHRLDIIDKHRSIIPTMTGVEFSLPRTLCDVPEDEQFFDPFPDRKQVWDGKIIVSGTADDSPPIGTQGRCSTRLALDDEYLRGHDLVDTLQHQIEVVRGVLYSFATGTKPTFVDAPSLEPVAVPAGAWIAVRDSGI